MRTVAIVQVRMDSQRLPGKALMKIGDKTILDHVVNRALLIGCDEVVLATGNSTNNKPLVEWSIQNDVPGFAGSDDDVLDRFYRATLAFDATHVLRITADCPLLDPGLNGRIVQTLAGSKASYISVATRSNGLVQEAFTVEALTEAWRHADTPYDREHVVPWMLRNCKMRFLAAGFDLGNGRWCVDTQEDLDRLRAMYDKDPQLFERSAAELVGAHVS